MVFVLGPCWNRHFCVRRAVGKLHSSKSLISARTIDKNEIGGGPPRVACCTPTRLNGRISSCVDPATRDALFGWFGATKRLLLPNCRFQFLRTVLCEINNFVILWRSNMTSNNRRNMHVSTLALTRMQNANPVLNVARPRSSGSLRGQMPKRFPKDYKRQWNFNNFTIYRHHNFAKANFVKIALLL